MSKDDNDFGPRSVDASDQAIAEPIRVLLLDDDVDSLLLRSTILRKYGYLTETASTIEEAEEMLDRIDIAVLDYHLGAGKFGTEVAADLRERRPEVPIIILSATLERHFGGSEDMHLLKGYSSVEDLLSALSSLEAKRRGVPVVVDARDFFYSRIAMAIGSDVLVQILDDRGVWMHCNDAAAEYLGQGLHVAGADVARTGLQRHDEGQVLGWHPLGQQAHLRVAEQHGRRRPVAHHGRRRGHRP